MVQPPRTTVRNHQAGLMLPTVLTAHIRWVLVLAKLKELDSHARAKSKDSHARCPTEVYELTKTFAAFFREAQLPPSARDMTEKKKWKKWFTGENRGSPLNSVYQLRAFYGLDAPNNLAQRFANMVRAAEEGSVAKLAASEQSSSKYDDAIREWGDYALELIDANGGCESFFACEKLESLIDVWPGRDRPIQPQDGTDKDSFINRVLHLERDRYVQLLTATVSVLWPLWFLRDAASYKQLFKDLSRIEDRNYRVGPAIPSSPDKELFIDVNTRIGRMDGLPYPFGFADKAVTEAETDYGRSWNQQAVNCVAEELKRYQWNAPLLLAGRGDQWKPRKKRQSNYAVPLIHITIPCDSFARIYRRTDAVGHLEDLRIACETKTWGDKVLGKFQQLRHVDRLSLAEMFQRFDDGRYDMIFSYSPVDVLLQTNTHFRRLTRKELYADYADYADGLSYTLSSTVLAGGLFLPRQPSMRRLLLELGTYLLKVERIFQHLGPQWEMLEYLHNRLLESHNPQSKIKVAEDIARLYQVVTAESLMRVPADALPAFARKIGSEMMTALASPAPAHESVREEALRAFDTWAWADLLEYVKYTSITFSSEIFARQ